MKSLLTRARLFCGFFEPFFFLDILRLSCAHLISSSIMAVTFACESRCARKLAYMCRMPARLSAISEGELTTKICQLRLQCEFQKFTFPSNDMLHIAWASETELGKRQFFVCRSSPKSTRSRLSRCSSAREKFLFSVERYIDGKKMESDSN